jgi:type II secretory pathway pseudopilin PulG
VLFNLYALYHASALAPVKIIPEQELSEMLGMLNDLHNFREGGNTSTSKAATRANAEHDGLYLTHTHNIPFSLHVENRRRIGFTLLELVGVMVVITILLALALPSTVDLIQVQRSVDDRAELPKIAEALKRGMLREQIFPVYENDASLPTTGSGRENFWWNLAARHGGGTANEIRYPLGVRPGSENTRNLYLAETSWSGSTFFGIVSNNQLNWIQDPLNPLELRLLLLSTTSSDLPLPDTLSRDQFNNFWDDWAVGFNGNPSGAANLSAYGLSGAEWAGRAADLNVERIDLRDWLCTVVIENRRAIKEGSGTRFDENNSQFAPLAGDWAPGSVYAFTENQNAAEVVLSTTEAGDGNEPPGLVTRIEAVTLSKRGRLTDASIDPTIVVGGSKITTSPDPPLLTTLTPTKVTIELSLTDRARIALFNPEEAGEAALLSDWTNEDEYIQNRYFLLSQELRLLEPWLRPDDSYPEVGIFTITEPFSTLRFDGLEWHY